MFVFSSWYQTLTVVLRPSKKIMVGAQLVVEPGLSARFQRGMFTTDDPEVAELLRQKVKYDHRIVEVTAEAAAFESPKAAPNQRGPATALDLKMDAKTKLEEKSLGELKCPICDKQFKTNQNLSIHMVTHRAPLQVTDTPEEKPKAE